MAKTKARHIANLVEDDGDVKSVHPCLWDAPVAYPDDGKHYTWDEKTTNLVLVELT